MKVPEFLMLDSDACGLHTAAKLGTLNAVNLGKSYRNLEILEIQRSRVVRLKPQSLKDAGGELLIQWPSNPGAQPVPWIGCQGENFWGYLSILASAFVAWKLQPGANLHSRGSGFWIFPDQRVWILTPGLMELTPGLFTEQLKKDYLPLIHPDWSGEKALAFFLAAGVYRSLKNQWPWDGTEEEIHLQMRQRIWPPMAKVFPGLNSKIADLMDRGFSGKFQRGDLGLWQEALKTPYSTLIQSLDPAEQLRMEQEAQKDFSRSETRWKIRDWLRRYKGALLLSGAGVLLLLGILGVPAIRVSAEDPWNQALPSTLVETYYQAINQLKDRALDKFQGPGLDSPAWNQDRSDTTKLFIFQEGRRLTLGTSGLVDTGAWLLQGKPALPQDQTLYGVGPLDVEDLGKDEFRITYERWRVDGNQSPRIYRGWQVVDHMVFQWTEKGYRLKSLQRQETSLPEIIK